MGFIVILALATAGIAAVAAYFSVIGLASIFTGIYWSVIIMGSALELGKLVAASFVYRYWQEITTTMKAYLISAVLVLMAITSAGIFGMLSSGYQQDILPIKQKKQQIALLIEEKEELSVLKQERLNRRKQIDNDIASLPNNYVTARQRLMKSYGPELDRLREDIAFYTDQIRKKTLKISELKAETLEAEAHVGPIIFIADVFNSEVDNATKWLILLIIFAFDPLAVMLTIGTNMAIIRREKEMKKEPELHSEHHVNDEAEPVVEEQIEQHILSEPDPQINSIDDLKMVLEEMNQKQEHELTDEEKRQKGAIEELLTKKNITRKLRNPNAE